MILRDNLPWRGAVTSDATALVIVSFVSETLVQQISGLWSGACIRSVQADVAPVVTCRFLYSVSIRIC